MTPDAARWVELQRALARAGAAADPRVEVIDADGLLASWVPGQPHALYVTAPTPALPAAVGALPDLRWVWARTVEAPGVAQVLGPLGWVPWKDRVLAMLLDEPGALGRLLARTLPAGVTALDVDRPDRLPLLQTALAEGFGLPEESAAELAAEVPGLGLVRVAVDGPGAVLAAARAVPAGGAVHLQQVCTLPGARRRGLAAALSAGLLRDLAARSAALAAGPEGVATWRALGFRTVDTWTTWQRSSA